MLWTVSACSSEPAPTTEDTETIPLPTLDESKTPLELLQAAAAKTHALTVYSVDYARSVGEDCFTLSGQLQTEPDGSCTAEITSRTFSKDGTRDETTLRRYNGKQCYELRGIEEQKTEAASPYTPSQILFQMEEFIGREDLLPLFSTYPMTVSPSENGAFRYQLSSLSREDFAYLLYGDPEASLPEASDAVNYEVNLTTAPDGTLSKLEFQGGLVQIHLTIINQETPVSSQNQ